jgi:D-alanine-D-alanine ligase
LRHPARRYRRRRGEPPDPGARDRRSCTVAFPIRRIAILTGDHQAPDETKRGGRYNEEDFEMHRAMLAVFAGMTDYIFECWTDHDIAVARIEKDPPDLVINFCDTGFRNVPTLELALPALMEMHGVPYTGAPPAAMVLAFDKAIVRLVAQQIGIPVPREHFIPADASPDALPALYPALLKPNRADGSVGITKDSVVHNRAEAAAYFRRLQETLPGRDVLMQEYLPGPEYGVGLIGNPEDGIDALPVLEVDFSRLPKDLAPILSWESKAFPDSPYWTEIKFKRAAIPEAEAKAMVDRSVRLFRRFGMRDYARFDFRRGADGEIKMMEVNPNPAWAPDGKLAHMASFGGISYPEMLKRFLDGAIRRVEREAKERSR